MTLNDIKSHYRTFKAAAAAAGCSQSSISNWKKRGKVPLPAQMKFEVLTKGALRTASRDLSLIAKRRALA